MRYIPVYSFDIANQLIKKGFNIAEIKPNYNTKGHLVFYFEDISELRKVLKEDYNINWR